ncbi:MAG: 6-phosphogluconolactonase [Bacteroidales bacterium]|nr:6-phosphogluconolactonase [Bacteroidales bacterium]
MNLTLSSQINLNRIPERYYKPKDAFEESAISRYERLKTDIYESHTVASASVARQLVGEIKKSQEENRHFLLVAAGGRSLQPLWAALRKEYKDGNVSFRNVVFFLAYEFFPIQNGIGHNLRMLKDQFLDHIDIPEKQIFSPDGTIEKRDINTFCHQYEELIASYGGIDFLLLGVGYDGIIALNEPGSTVASPTRLTMLSNESREEASKQFGSIEHVPYSAITLGIGTLMQAKQVTLLAWGEEKANIIKEIVEGRMSELYPASYMQMHRRARLVIDLTAALHLTRINTPWLVTSCEWDNKLIRRAVVKLSLQRQLPILKLTNKEYNEGGLGELLALYGSAYDVNIRVFNDLQHTITGWPGGKPNADDTYRPERSVPYPKKVLIFSPHPDDDVISMGGCFHRLIQQGHDVHIAYQTSGNIAVADEEVVRYLTFLKGLKDSHVHLVQNIGEHPEKLLQALKERNSGDEELPEILALKALIRRVEATAACTYIGVKSENIHFLNLPFYETGKIEKKPLGEADVLIVKDLIQHIQPHQIYLAGDLMDPHGTHKVCLDAALAAIDDLKQEAWMDDCRIWMYRGAWAEWDIDHIEMAVPLSPEELRQKRNAILRHQSQMESAPFLGGDERLFWQRSEDRNRATAGLYNRLGLASYEAIEAFVEYRINR